MANGPSAVASASPMTSRQTILQSIACPLSYKPNRSRHHCALPGHHLVRDMEPGTNRLRPRILGWRWLADRQRPCNNSSGGSRKIGKPHSRPCGSESNYMVLELAASDAQRLQHRGPIPGNPQPRIACTNAAKLPSAFDPRFKNLGGGLTPLPTYFSAADVPATVTSSASTLLNFDNFNPQRTH